MCAPMFRHGAASDLCKRPRNKIVLATQANHVEVLSDSPVSGIMYHWKVAKTPWAYLIITMQYYINFRYTM